MIWRMIWLLAGVQMLSLSLLTAQPWRANLSDSETNFYKIRAEFRAYWSGRNFDIRGGEEGKPWVQFKRWEWFMEPRVYPSGELPAPDILRTRLNEYRASTPQQAGGGSWTLLGPSVVPSGGGGEGRINAVAIDPANTNVVWAGSASGGLWKSTDGGSSWSTATDDFPTLGVSAIAFDPLNSSTMYIATGDADGLDTYSVGVLKSTDGGASWNETALSRAPSQGFSIYSLVAHPTDSGILLAAGRQGIFRTTDAGVSWTTITSGNFKDLAVDPSDPAIWFAAQFASGVYKSVNSGVSFSKLTGGLPSSGFGRIAIAVAPSLPSTLYALYVNPDQGLFGLYQSTDSGGNWSLQSNSPNILSWDGTGTDGQGWYDLVLEVAPDNPGTVYAGGVNLYKSTSNGTSWTQLTNWFTGTPRPYIHADQHGLTFLPGSSSTFFAGNDGGVFLTTNSGTNWSDKSAGIATTQFYRLSRSATNPSRIYAGAQDNGTDRYLGGSWRQILDGDGMETIIDYTDETIGYAEVYFGDIYRTTNGGSSFGPISSSIPDTGAWVTPYVINPVNPRSLYVGETGVYKTTNRGSSWSTLKSLLDPTPLIALAIAPTDTNTLYAATGSRVWVSTNGGTAWNEISSGLPTASAAVTYLAVDPSNASTAYATFSGYGIQKVYKTTSSGSSWSNISSGLPGIPVNCIAVNPASVTDLYTGTDAGVYYSSDGGSGWVPFSTGLPNVIVNELDIHAGTQKLLAATYGRGLWESPVAVQVRGSISGMKFRDINGDGFNDPPDSGLAGWTIHLTVASPPSVISATTDGSGNYSFPNLLAGTYTLSEVPQPGWTQTYPDPPGTYAIVLGAGQDTTGFDFGNYLLPASISGTIFEDLNGDSVKDVSEPALSNWMVKISGVSPDSTLSDSAGNYTFLNLGPGTHTVSQVLQTGWHGTRPAGGSYQATVLGGNHVIGKDFGNYRPARIGGLKFNDLDQNGIRDSGETGIPGWIIHLSGPVSLSASTDSSGNYSFAGVPPGNYSVSESSEVGWAQTLPPGNAPYTVALTSGLDTTGFLFGNYFSPEKSYGVLDGWNLLSLPRRVPDSHKHSLYPSAISNAFAYAGAYQRLDTLPVGTGFWLKFPSEQNVFIDGPPIARDTIDLLQGWNIIGALTTPVAVSGVQQFPDGLVISNYFSYGSTGYQISDSLLPHHGYWVKTGFPGRLVISEGPSTAIPAMAQAGNPLKTGLQSEPPEDPGEMSTITFRDNRAGSRTLYIGCGTNPEPEPLFVLPPPPPEGAFDVRYGAGGIMASCVAQAQREFSIVISSAAYPLRLGWDLTNYAGAATLIVDRDETPIKGAGTIHLESPPAKISLRLGPAKATELPTRFSLEQNYPNPFNPATTVTFVVGAALGTGDRSAGGAFPVTLRVYDVLGREVATLVSGVRKPGTYRVEWNASHFPSGVYTYRLGAGGFVAVKKMILMR